jgi:hypothetical protein
VVSEHPRCAGLLHDGKRCRSVAVAGSEFCPHHAGLIEEHGADALKRGAHLPVRRKPIAQEPVMAEAIEATIGNGTVSVDPASVRPRLAAAAAESVDEIRRVLLETATGANRNLWATINCKHCGRAGRYEITVPDNKVRLADLDSIVEELRKAGVHLRNEIVTGVGGKQILLDDPSGNPVELFEPTQPEAALSAHR